MQYGQNISIPYSQPQTDLNFLNAAAAGVDHKGKIHPKIERDREEESSGIVGSQINSGNLNLSNLDTSSGFNIKGDVLKNGTNLASLALGGKPRPKPGEIRETKALDGSTLFCCPECQMAYPDRSLIEQHVVSHAVERRFVCDICNAALKRKDHLTRHKLSHIPDRPHVCNICMKSFKRKEQLTLHIVIHSGEKKHVCIECGKGFYRKDHLRKHTRSHIARRVKSEVSAQNVTGSGNANNTGGQTNNLHGS
uniref:C2H2-type domain-containing protein n=1 Tax=Glossina pallidipes TaxID=7398 RepID=A0A1B0A8M2_GLOPL